MGKCGFGVLGLSPPLLCMQLVAHVYANRVLLERWSKGDSGSFSVIPYPNAIVGYVLVGGSGDAQFLEGGAR